MLTPELEAYIRRVIPQVNETYQGAKEREAMGEVRKLYAIACRDLTPIRNVAARFIFAPPKVRLDKVYWPSSPPVFREIFQTDLRWPDVGLEIIVPSPDLTQQKRTVLKVSANGIDLSFTKELNPSGDNFYYAKWKMRKSSPLVRNQETLQRAPYFEEKVEQISQNSREVPEFLEFTARFSLEASETRGFNRRSPRLF